MNKIKLNKFQILTLQDIAEYYHENITFDDNGGYVYFIYNGKTRLQISYNSVQDIIDKYGYCSTCGDIKPFDEFNADGDCKDCEWLKEEE